MRSIPGTPQKRRLAVLVAIPAIAAVVVAFLVGFGGQTVPDNAVAVVDGTPIEREQFDRWLEIVATQQAAEQQQQFGQEDEDDFDPETVEVPEEGTPEWEQLRDQALGFLVQLVWLEKEAEDRGITVTDRQVEERLQQIKQQAFGTTEEGEEDEDADVDAEFQEAIERLGSTEDEYLLRVRNELLLEQMREEIAPQPDPGEEPAAAAERLGIGDNEVRAFYDENAENFQQPETRDLRQIVAEDEEQAQEALEALGDEPSAEDWESAAEEYSTDEATREDGGRFPGVTRGQSESAVDQAVFDAEEGELLGPIEGQAGWYVVQVESITGERTQPLDEVRDQILAQLVSQRQAEENQRSEQRFVQRWQSETTCAEGFRAQMCDNADTEDQPSQETRTVRLLLNSDEERAREARNRIESDSSAENWRVVTEELSEDEATKPQAGLQEGIGEGALEEALDEAVFDARRGEIGGPVQTERGFWIFRVIDISGPPPVTGPQVVSVTATSPDPEAGSCANLPQPTERRDPKPVGPIPACEEQEAGAIPGGFPGGIPGLEGAPTPTQ